MPPFSITFSLFFFYEWRWEIMFLLVLSCSWANRSELKFSFFWTDFTVTTGHYEVLDAWEVYLFKLLLFLTLNVFSISACISFWTEQKTKKRGNIRYGGQEYKKGIRGDKRGGDKFKKHTHRRVTIINKKGNTLLKVYHYIFYM